MVLALLFAIIAVGVFIGYFLYEYSSRYACTSIAEAKFIETKPIKSNKSTPIHKLIYQFKYNGQTYLGVSIDQYTDTKAQKIAETITTIKFDPREPENICVGPRLGANFWFLSIVMCSFEVLMIIGLVVLIITK